MSISAWFDRWYVAGPLSEFISARDVYNARFTNECTLDKLINNGEWTWPEEWLVKFPVLNTIQVPILLNDAPDRVMWESNDGNRTEYATRIVWKDMGRSGNKVMWQDVVWFPQSIPRHSFVLWMAVQYKLMT